MFNKSITGNSKRSFDPSEAKHLGTYVYALKDPRDGKIFYVGQGNGNRVFAHFEEAADALKNDRQASSKVIRILDIWKNEEDVEWIIIAHGLSPENVDQIESAVFDVLCLSPNGELLNDNRCPNSSLLTQSDLLQLSAQGVNPAQAYQKIFIFPIQNALATGRDPYDATRKAWHVTMNNQKGPAYAVGLNRGFSVGSFNIENWQAAPEDSYYSIFTGAPAAEVDLLHKNWQAIINQARGFYQRGNYLIVEFNGQGQARIVRGSADKSWFDLASS